MLRARVSNIESFRQWRDDENDEHDVEWFLRRLREEEPPTPAMLAGTAFHTALELAEPCETSVAEVDGFRFELPCDATIQLPTVREVPAEKDYGNLLVRGRIDGMTGNEITDYKTTREFHPERYLEGYQWRYYLDMTGADLFTWIVFELRERAGFFDVQEVHKLYQCRYPRLHQDCADLASDYAEFIAQFKPEQYLPANLPEPIGGPE